MFCLLKIHTQVKYGMVFCLTKTKSCDGRKYGIFMVIFVENYHNTVHNVHHSHGQFSSKIAITLPKKHNRHYNEQQQIYRSVFRRCCGTNSTVLDVSSSFIKYHEKCLLQNQPTKKYIRKRYYNHFYFIYYTMHICVIQSSYYDILPIKTCLIVLS